MLTITIEEEKYMSLVIISNLINLIKRRDQVSSPGVCFIQKSSILQQQQSLSKRMLKVYTSTHHSSSLLVRHGLLLLTGGSRQSQWVVNLLLHTPDLRAGPLKVSVH